MGLFDIFSKKTKPYKNEGLNKFYDLLFCDNIELYQKETLSTEYPWNVLLEHRPKNEKLQEIVNDNNVESRHKILAYNLLLSKYVTIDKKDILGVIIEVSLPKGLDTLAVYSDGTARYINHSEQLLVWEKQTQESTQLIVQLFSDSVNVVNQIGPWHEERKLFPSKGMIRLTFLVSDGLYFGEGPIEVLQSDPMGGPVINSATQLMAYLTQQVKHES